MASVQQPRRTSSGALVLAALLATGAFAQSRDKATDPEAEKYFDEACMAKAVRFLKRKNAIHEGYGRTGLPMLDSASADRVLDNGQWRGSLPTLSTVSPPSSYSLVQYSERLPLKRRDQCPLDETYLVFRQGGFMPQPAMVFGPLNNERAGTMEQHFWLGAFTAANTLLLTLLALNVSRVRLRERVAHGDGGVLALKKAMRAHGNGVEHLVVAGLQVLALELMGAGPVVMATLVLVFTGSRIVHAAGMLTAAPGLRRAGAVGTYLSELGGVVAVLGLMLPHT